MEEFRKTIQRMKALSVKEVTEKIDSKEDFILFVGRETCPYCRRFVKKLDALIDQKGWAIDYINSEDSSQMDQIQVFRQTYNIPTVPGFMVQKDGDIKVVCDSSLPPEDIIAFVEK